MIIDCLRWILYEVPDWLFWPGIVCCYMAAFYLLHSLLRDLRA